jgi:hypothetical protein
MVRSPDELAINSSEQIVTKAEPAQPTDESVGGQPSAEDQRGQDPQRPGGGTTTGDTDAGRGSTDGGNSTPTSYTPLLLKLAHKNAYGRAGGAGIKLFPDELLNLHYWVFDEDAFVTPSTGAVTPLPCRDCGWLYTTGNGLPSNRSRSNSHGR